jgi:hypothetical protein
VNTKPILFYTKDAGLSPADAARMEAEGMLCVKVKDPSKITTPNFSSAQYMPSDRVGLLVWKAMCSSSTAKDKFGTLMIAEIDARLKDEQS